MLTFLKALHNDESGQGLVEYLLIIALVALAATAGMSSAASYINSPFIRMGQKLGGTSARREQWSNQSNALASRLHEVDGHRYDLKWSAKNQGSHSRLGV